MAIWANVNIRKILISAALRKVHCDYQGLKRYKEKHKTRLMHTISSNSTVTHSNMQDEANSNINPCKSTVYILTYRRVVALKTYYIRSIFKCWSHKMMEETALDDCGCYHDSLWPDWHLVRVIVISTCLKCLPGNCTVHTACLQWGWICFLEGKTQSEVWKIHLSRDYFLGHRIHAQGVRVTGFNTPALQHNSQAPPLFTVQS